MGTILLHSHHTPITLTHTGTTSQPAAAEKLDSGAVMTTRPGTKAPHCCHRGPVLEQSPVKPAPMAPKYSQVPCAIHQP